MGEVKSMTFTTVFVIIQFIFSCIIGIYFYTQLKRQESSKTSIEKESRKKMEQLHRLRRIHLTEPLAEKTRPQTLQDIVGQEEGIKALKAALCGPNPQHVLIYGPPGIGKTAAARVILEEAKKSAISPFQETACFVEMDATTMRFDDRGIADPLSGRSTIPFIREPGPTGRLEFLNPKRGL
ncbi:MAG: AAA family ATPase [Clostridia bacterium]